MALGVRHEKALGACGGASDQGRAARALPRAAIANGRTDAEDREVRPPKRRERHPERMVLIRVRPSCSLLHADRAYHSGELLRVTPLLARHYVKRGVAEIS